MGANENNENEVKMRIGVLSAAVIGFAILACNPFIDSINGSGNVVANSMEFSGFTNIEAGSSFQVTITQSEDYSVVIKADDNLVEHLNVRLDGDTLVINMVPGKSARNATLEAEVSLPELKRVHFGGVSRGNLLGITSQADLTVRVSGASSLQGDLQARQMNVNVSGASKIDLNGSGATVDLHGSGASTVDMEDFAVDSAQVVLSGASTARLHVNDDIGPVTLSGASRLIYSGDPAFRDFETSGASSITASE